MKKLLLALCGLLICQLSYGFDDPLSIIQNVCGGTARGNVKSWTFDKNTKVNYDDKCRVTSASIDKLGVFSFSYIDSPNDSSISCSLRDTAKGVTLMNYFKSKDSTCLILYNEKGQLMSCSKINLDSHGNRLKFVQTDGNGKVSSVQTFKNKYNAKGDIIETQTYEKGILSSIEIYKQTYDASGNIIETKTFRKGAVQSTLNFSYDEKGTLISEKETDAKGKVVFVRKYNSYGDLVQDIRYNDGEESRNRTYTYVYDSKGNWTESTETLNSKYEWQNYTVGHRKEIVYY